MLPSDDAEAHAALVELAAARQDYLWHHLPAGQAAAASEIADWMIEWHNLASTVELLRAPLSLLPRDRAERLLSQLSASLAWVLRQPAASEESESLGAAPLQTGPGAVAAVLGSGPGSGEGRATMQRGERRRPQQQRQQVAGPAAPSIDPRLVIEAAGLCAAALGAALQRGYEDAASESRTLDLVKQALGGLRHWLPQGAAAGMEPAALGAALGAAEAALRLATQLAALRLAPQLAGCSALSGAAGCFASSIVAADCLLLRLQQHTGAASWPAEWAQHAAVSASKMMLVLTQLPETRRWGVHGHTASVLIGVSAAARHLFQTQHGSRPRWVNPCLLARVESCWAACMCSLLLR